jgi:hypothetical protein
MRHYLLLLLLSAYSVSLSAQWTHVETAHYDWNRDGKAYTFVLDIPKSWDAAGDYSRLRIFAPSGAESVFTDDDGLTTLSDDLSPNWVLPHLSALIKRNPVRSNHLLFLPFKRNSKKPFLLFMVGWAYASSPGSLHIIALNKGVPEQVLYKEQLGLQDYFPDNGDGSATIIGFPCLSQTWGNGLLTYDPYLVFSLPSTGPERAQLSIPLSKEYNLQHYYGWAGPDCSEKLAVVLHPPGGGKPVIMEAKKAEALTEKSYKH